MKYKIGDKVKVLNTQYTGVIAVDSIQEVTELGHTWVGLGEQELCFRFNEIEPYKETKLKDSIVKEVRKDLKDRSNVGIKKYGVTLDRKDLDLLDWLQHSYEEVLDTALYLKRAIKELKTTKNK
jgi:hypothetical protein